MGGSHTHAASEVRLAGGSVRVLLGFLLACLVATVVAVVALWPDADRVEELRTRTPYAAEGVSFPEATVTAVTPPCADERSRDQTCGKLTVEVDEGSGRGDSTTVDIPLPVSRAGIEPGDTVRLQRIEPPGDQPTIYAYDGVVRTTPLWILGAVFVLVVAAVARLRGILALVGLGFGGLVLFGFMLPALLSGSSGVAVALAGASAIMFVVLYVAHGPSVRTSAALAGTLLGIGITAAVGELAVRGATLSGASDDSALMLTGLADLSFHGLLMSALVIAGLGVLNDVTITQASAVWELRAAGPGLTRRELFTSGMRIGRDHIASTIYTIVFAYAGSALAVLLLISLYDLPLWHVLTFEAIAEEIVRTLVSGIGLVLAVPVTTAIAAVTVSERSRSANEDEVDAYQRRH